jgi:hypothetical protein
MDKSNQDLQSEWLPALQRGIAGIGRTDLLTPGDLQMVFYQDIYRDGAKVVCPADLIESERRIGPLQAKLNVARMSRDFAVAEAAQADATIRSMTYMEKSGAVSKASVKEAMDTAKTASARATAADKELLRAQSAVDAETRAIAGEFAAADIDFVKKAPKKLKDKVAEFFSGLFGSAVAKSDTAMAALFPDTDRYITLRSFRCATNARLSTALTNAKAAGRPIILVGHSMGTLVSYDTLFHDDVAEQAMGKPPRYHLNAFVSLGSQLGVPPLVEAFSGGYAKPPAPRSILTWRNMRGDDDYVAPSYIEDHYEIPASLRYNEYSVATIAGSPHNISGYLENAAVATSIAAAWCGAFSAVSVKPKGCDGLDDLPGLASLPGGAKLKWPKKS